MSTIFFVRIRYLKYRKSRGYLFVLTKVRIFFSRMRKKHSHDRSSQVLPLFFGSFNTFMIITFYDRNKYDRTEEVGEISQPFFTF